MRKWFDLGTDSKAVARRKLARLAKEHAETSAPPEQLAISAARHETVSEAADRIFRERESEVRDIVNDPIRLKKHVASHIGKMIVTAVGSSDIRDVLDQAKEQGKSRRTLTHIRRVMNLIFGSLWQDGVLKENPVARLKVPERSHGQARTRGADRRRARSVSRLAAPRRKPRHGRARAPDDGVHLAVL